MNIKSLVVTAVLATAILCSGGLVSAQTTDNSALIAQLQAQIATLMAQIKAIQAQQGTTQTWCHTFTANLGFVNSGTTDISALHTVLQKEGFSYGADSDTTYAEDTSAAVVQFQEKYGITQTGYVGTKTRVELNTLYGCGTTVCPLYVMQVCGSDGKTYSGNSCLGYGMPSGVTVASQGACTTTTSSITVTSPVAGTVYHVGDTINISWATNGITGTLGLGVVNTSGTVVAGPGGMGTLGMISVNVSNTGNYSWQIPSNFVAGNNYRVSVSAYNNGSPMQGYSGYFSIASSTAPACLNGAGALLPGQSYCVSHSSITVTSPSGGETWKVGETHNITWTSAGVTGNVTIWRGSSTGAFSMSANKIVTLAAIVGSYPWLVDSSAVGSDVIEIVANSNIVGTSKAFNVMQPGATCTPNWTCGWSSCVNGSQTQGLTDSNNCGVPLTNATIGCPVLTQTCNSAVAPSITVTSPNGGETWIQGSAHNITWTSSGLLTSDHADISLSGQGSGLIVTGPLAGGYNANSIMIPASTGSYSWTIPSYVVPGNYKIQISSDNNSSVQDLSDNYFSITAPVVTTPLAVSCAPVSSTSVLGQRINWTSTVSGGSGSYTYNWSGSMFKAATLQTASPSSPGGTTQSLTVVDSAGNSATATCSVIVLSTTPAPGTGCNALYQCVTGGTGAPCSVNSDCATATNGGPIVVHCSASPAVAVVGDPIVWSALAGGAKRGEFYNYSWQGDATGTGVTTGSFYGLPAMSYSTVGTKTAFVTITVSGGTALATCSTIIVATPADIAGATPIPTVATPIDATQATMIIGTPTIAIAASGQNVRLTLSSPNASHSSLYFACPAGVSMRTSPETCNTSMNTSLMSDWSPEFFNLTSQDQNVVATYSVVTSSGTSTATTTITVHPEVAAMNIGQSSLASISDAIANIVAELKAMLNK